jgi:predicted nucleic acid-binding protein
MRIYLDSNIVIHVVEHNPSLSLRVAIILSQFRLRGDTFLASDLTRFECLVGPIKKGLIEIQDCYRKFFDRPEIQISTVTAIACERAAHIRARHRLSPMDSLQLAIAMEAGADLFLTGDKALESFPELKVELVA